MFSWWHLGLLGHILVNMCACQDTNPLSIDADQMDEPPVTVRLSVETMPKSHIAGVQNESPQKQLSELFSCHECTNCDSTSESTIRSCDAGITMCYKVEDKNKIIRRGCATARCTIPDGDQSSRFDSITCCTTPKCNQGIQSKPLWFLSVLLLLTILIINI
ncbi:unnamed protein product [Adineta ricciae]|uniref:UPAR/Ly6 domain-containing protein n=1 Tax=Adineta ricciae TaxID=249248 RepID=A0A813V9Y2_ADIRI|nr:unnamed protein product [Adineta ricciae]CAF1326999.1 unnamed protein product [Adineta ricciae]